MAAPASNPERGKPAHEFHIQIDRTHFTTTSTSLTGTELRNLPSPPISSDRELYVIRPGETDLPVGDTDPVAMRDGLRFFTAPREINPGSPSAQ